MYFSYRRHFTGYVTSDLISCGIRYTLIHTDHEEDYYIKALLNALRSAAAEDYRNFEQYLLGLYEHRQSWALYCCQDLPTRWNNTNNMVESAFWVLKDKVFARTRAYSVPQLFGFVTDSVDEYFSSKLLTALSGKTCGQRSRYMPSSTRH